MSDFYSEQILEHYRHPRNKGRASKPAGLARESNPLCGDILEISLAARGGRVTQAKFDGISCAISQAAASLLTEQLKGKTLRQVEALRDADALRLLGVTVNPAREKCALLAAKTARKAAANALEREKRAKP